MVKIPVSHTGDREFKSLPIHYIKKNYEKISIVTNTAEVIARKILVMFIDLLRADA